jgi:hypothetical protein
MKNYLFLIYKKFFYFFLNFSFFFFFFFLLLSKFDKGKFSNLAYIKYYLILKSGLHVKILWMCKDAHVLI